MLRQEQIAQVIDAQTLTYKPRRGEIVREQLPFIKNIPEFASIITGLRRVGKMPIFATVISLNEH